MSVVVSHVSSTVDKDRIQEFFTFCGTIKSVEQLESDSSGKNTFHVTFALEKAVSTAELLDGAELGENPIVVKVVSEENEKLPSYTEVAGGGGTTNDHKVQEEVSEELRTGDSEYDGIVQEDKPKRAILAQLLAQGYNLSDSLIERGVDYDRKRGYTSRIKSFVTDVDKKYVGASDPGTYAGRGIAKAQEGLAAGLATSWKLVQQLRYYGQLQSYIDGVANHPYGIKAHSVYTQLSREVGDVHREASRLFELKKQQRKDQGSDAV